MSDGVRTIGSRLELFVDDWLVERMEGVRLKLQQPVEREVALTFDRPWEGPFSYDPVTLLDGGRYRMWYRAGDHRGGRTGYAESEDGVAWRRVPLGLIEHEGSRENNLVIADIGYRGLSIFKDPNAGVPDGERYKATAVGPPGLPQVLRGLVSPDGLRWSPIQPDPLLVAPGTHKPMFDSHNIAMWDSNLEKYAIYARGWLRDVPENPEGGIRTIRRSVSPDFRSWSEPELIDLGDSPREHLYKNACVQYFRAPHIYLMFPKRFVANRKFQPDWHTMGISETVFMSSRDGMRWDRRFMEAFLRPGPDPRNWTDRSMYAGSGLVPTGPTELSFYHMENYGHPTCRVRRATVRTDGFVSVNAPYGGGELVTRPLAFEGRELVLNYATSAAGSIRVEVQDAGGTPLPGHGLEESVEIFGDEIERVVAWRGGAEVEAPAGQPVRLRFVMKDADLYSLRFR
jgi:hypothetical protein